MPNQLQVPAASPWTDHVEALTQKIADILTEKMDASMVWLFGSYARGDAGPDSDVDFLVVVPTSSKTRYQRAVEALYHTNDIHIPKDIIVLTQAEWEKHLKAPSSLGSIVLREGVILAP